jgi:hypothetical protein
MVIFYEHSMFNTKGPGVEPCGAPEEKLKNRNLNLSFDKTC